MRRVVEALGQLRREVADVGSEDRDDPAGQQLSRDLAEVVVRGRAAVAAVEARVLPQDRAVQLAEGRARLDPELVHERAASVLVGLERLRLPAGAIEREHQLRAQTLAQRILGDERLQLADELGVEPGLEVGVDALLEHRQP